jgi:hypothetical protein
MHFRGSMAQCHLPKGLNGRSWPRGRWASARAGLQTRRSFGSAQALRGLKSTFQTLGKWHWVDGLLWLKLLGGVIPL